MRLRAEEDSGDSVVRAPSIPRASTIRCCPNGPIIGFNRAGLGGLKMNVGDGMLTAIFARQVDQIPGNAIVCGMIEVRTVTADPDLATED